MTLGAEGPDQKKRKTEDGKDEDSVYADTNAMPRFGNPGRVLHLGLADGELAERVVIVGHHSRAEIVASFLQPEKQGGELFRLASDRGFLTFTGLLDGTRISVVSIGMGIAMMDFFVREARAVVHGPMAVVRFGTCGCLKASVEVGSLSVASEGSVLVQRNYDHFHRSNSGELKEDEKHEDHLPYHISALCPPDGDLNKALVSSIKKDLGENMVAEGVNVTADSFYGSQGRDDPRFNDRNKGLIDELLKRHPEAVSMEMETFQLLHMAQSCRPAGSMRASAAVVNVANRPTGAVVSEEGLKRAEREGGLAILRALASLHVN